MSDQRYDRVKSLFLQVLDRPEEERLEFLKTSSDGDADVEARVLALLREHREVEAEGATDGPSARLREALKGRYTVERELGVGGMATVHLAQDLKHDRKVAIKVLHPELAARLGAERFLSEIRITANLQHPHILPLHDSGEADGLLYYVMPFVEGESLRERLEREGQLPVEEAVGIAMSVARALDYAHRQGVVHRDIKPGNILLQDGEPVVADFGIALAVSGADDVRLTGTGVTLGTPLYMSPEQVTGAAEVTAQADIYALGCVLYEMLGSEPPHAASSAAAVVARMMSGPPPSISETRPKVPEAVAVALTRALALDPADRFVTAADFAEALAGGRVAGAYRPPLLTSARSRWVAAAAVLAVLAAWWGLQTAVDGPPRIGRLAVLPPQNLTGSPVEDYVLAGVHLGLNSVLSQVLDVTARQSALRFEGSTATVQEIAGALNVQAVLTNQLMRMGDSVQIAVQLIEAFPEERQLWDTVFTASSAKQLELFGQVALGVADEAGVGLPAERRARLAAQQVLNPQAVDAYRRGSFILVELIGGHDQAIQHFQRAIQLEPEWAPPHAGLAGAYLMKASWWGQGLTFEEAMVLAGPELERALELDPNLADAYTLRARIEFEVNFDFEAADSAYERAAELGASVLGLLSHANFLTITGRPDEAIVLAEQAVELSPLEPTVHNELAWALQGAGRYEEALARFQVSMAIDSTFYQTHGLLMQVHMWMGNAEAAWAELEWMEAHGGVRIPRYVGYLLAVTGRSAEAREILDELTRQAEAGEGPRFWDRALIHVGLGEYEAALELLERGLEAGEGDITLKASRYWDPLRSDARFQDLLRRMGFAE